MYVPIFRNFTVEKFDRYALPQQQPLQFSDYADLYDLIIPQDNLLRQINDISFIQLELIDKYCQDNGCMAESPVRMFY